MKALLLACSRRFTLLGLAALGLFSSGCATPALWKHTAARVWEPSSIPEQFLVTTRTGRQEVVVVFVQAATIAGKPKLRVLGWNLRASPAELSVGPRAVRHLTNMCERVQVMPVFANENTATNTLSSDAGYAVRGPSREKFIVHLEGIPPGPYELPTSAVTCRYFARVAVMPFAVATDAVIVGTVLAAAGGAGAGGVSVSR